MRYNVLRNDRIMTISNAADGISDALFNAGVRIYQHDLSMDNALKIVQACIDYDYTTLERFTEMLLGTEREPGNFRTNVQSKFKPTKWDNPYDQRKVY